MLILARIHNIKKEACNTEENFWKFLINALKQGRATQVSMVTGAKNADGASMSKFIGGHSLLPKNYNKIPKGTIKEIGDLLLRGDCKSSTKEAILMLLAHHPTKAALNTLKIYNENPDKDLKFYARLALDECMMWNE
ncbi:MAG: hypothetical protein HQ575_06275 [Candidatus Omnitrophica bacterium]|nr:hypothetical protein [Candidatus Omnitrophota bacterium]